MVAPNSLVRFHQRYCFSSFGDEAVLLDLETGGYFMLNGTAQRICRILFEEAPGGDAERRVATELNLQTAAAQAAIEEVARQLDAMQVRVTFPGPFTYLATGSGYNLCFDDVPILEIGPDGLSARQLPLAAQPVTLAHALRVAAPKLLSLRGLTVLHASSCRIGSGLTAFCGLSGAGKTTTARAFADAGMALFSEDLVVLEPGSEHSMVRALEGGERAAHAWARTAATEAVAHGETEIDCRSLPGLVLGDRTAIQLTRVVFIDSSRRKGNTILLRALKPAEALVQIMRSNFLGSANRQDWETYFQKSSSLARSLDTDMATMPMGVEVLKEAARLYRASSAS